MPSFDPEATSVLQVAIRFRKARGAVIGANIANVDTQGNRRRDISSPGVFEGAKAGLMRTDEGHLPTRPADPERARVELEPRGARRDASVIDLNQELVAAHRNAGAWIDQVHVLARLSTSTRHSIG